MLQYFHYTLLCILLFVPTAQAQQSDIDANTVHILYYDNIEFEEDPYQFSNGLPLENFKEHLEFFKNEAYQVIDLRSLSLLRQSKDTIDKKFLILIFNAKDDEAIKYALPFSKRYGYPIHFAGNFDDFSNKLALKNTIINAILNININSKNTDLITKNINDETSRFRESFSTPPTFTMINDVFYSQEIMPVLSRYKFNQILIPTNESISVSNNSNLLPYIRISPNFENLDVMRTYLNRRILPHGPITSDNILDHQTNMRDLSWGFNIPYSYKNEVNNMSCVDNNDATPHIFILENRVEIRHQISVNENTVTVHCTAPILDKNGNKSDTYRYMTLYDMF